MDESKKNKNQDQPQPGNHAIFTGGNFKWKKTRSEVWNELSTKMEAGTPIPTIRLYVPWLSAAAGLLLLIGLTAFLRYHSVEVSTGQQAMQTVDLPDGSTAQLNVNSQLTYYPYWWKIHRILTMEGEAFFEVEKGNKFSISSGPGRIEVLGTSFNVLSRDDILKVTCLTGSVKVTAASKKAEEEVVVIAKNTTAELKKSGKISLEKKENTLGETAWRTGSFYFTADPVQDVFLKFEQQYGITIQADVDTSLTYTGNFRIEKNVETVLDYVCPALGLTYIKESSGKYLIFKADE